MSFQYGFEPKNLGELIAWGIDIVIGLSWKVLLIASCVKYLFY